MEIQPREAIDIIKRMYKGTPTTDQLIALEMAYEALEKQQPLSRIVIGGGEVNAANKTCNKYLG